jgi:hypothetical protein
MNVWKGYVVNPKSLLFEDALADEGAPLFATQREFAKALVALPNSGFERKQHENVRIFIGQVLKPSNESGARPLSTNLRRAIPLAVATRIADAERAKAVSDQILDAINSIKESNGLARPYTDQFEWNRLMASTNNPELKRVVIVTGEPAETMPDESINAHLLTTAMIERIINLEGESTPEGPRTKTNPAYDKDAVYEFFIPKAATAYQMHLRLINSVKERFSLVDDELAEKLILSAQREGRLAIYALKDPGLLIPMCVFEPMSPRMEGYTLFYHEANQVSVSVLNRASLDNWIANFYLPIFNGVAENELLLKLYNPIPIGATNPIITSRQIDSVAA